MKYVPENVEALARELADGNIQAGSISCPPGSEFERIKIRPVVLKSGVSWQFEQFAGTKVFHRNVEESGLEAWLAHIFRSGVTNAEFTLGPPRASSSVAFTRTLRLVSNRRGAVTALRKETGRPQEADGKPDTENAAASFAPGQAHDHAKKYILEEGLPVPFLVDLGVMTPDGTVVRAKYDKFRQVNRFLEFIADVVPELEAAQAGSPRELTVVDFGCGKSYLTFAVYHYLSKIRHLPVRVIGLDLKEDVIAECSGLALRYGYDKLGFAVGNIADYTGCERADMVITLHACDTATDYALAQAVRWNARVILSVPCCQHELNAQLARAGGERKEAPEAVASTTSGGATSCGAATPSSAVAGRQTADIPDTAGNAAIQQQTADTADTARNGRAILRPAFRHGIIRERMAALLTDAMRAELLETAGYRVQILEFIDMSHTPKNLLIRAVRQTAAKDAAAKESAPKESPANGRRQADYERLRDFLGVEPTLERIITKENKER